MWYLYRLGLFIYTIHNVYSANTTVVVEQGTLFGEVLQTVTEDITYYSYKGIPYAKPPMGPYRFKAPHNPEHWDGVKNATVHGPVCPQVNPFSKVLSGDEDCLYLNVYSPCITPDELLSVMVFIPGGGFICGSGDDDFYGPDFFMNNNVVLVTLNYRIGALGFLCLDTKDVPGNAGLKDQVAALKWVKKNIHNFGGNPANITIFGESAGAASVAFHLVSPMSKGLFNRAIMLSGAPSLDIFIPFRPRARAFVLAKSLGYETTNVDMLYSFLTNVTYDLLINTTVNQTTVLASEEKTNLYFKFTPFTPVVEKHFGQERFLVNDIFESLSCVRKVDVLFGSSTQESLIMLPFYVNESYIEFYNRYPELFVPTKILISSSPDTILKLANDIIDHYFVNKSITVNNIAEFVNYASPAYILYDIYRFFNHWPHVSTYCYKFSAQSSRNYYSSKAVPYGLSGTSHLDILFNIFDPKTFNMTLTKNSMEYKIINQTTTIFTNFAKYGNPSPDSSLTWPLYNIITKAYVDINTNLTISYAPDEEDITFWKYVLEYAGIKF